MTQHQPTLESPALQEAYSDFILSRRAMNCKKATFDFYYFTVGKFLQWVETKYGVASPEQITVRQVREYVAEVAGKGRKDTTVWNTARAIRTMFIFWHNEGYMPTRIRFDMPRKRKRRQPTLNAEQLEQVLKKCNIREKALIMFMVDSGVRREETIKLNWSDVDMQSGRVQVKDGKGGKDRNTRVGTKTRAALFAYRQTLKNQDGALFKTDEETRFSEGGFLAIFRRLRKKVGIHFSPHAMRRTFTILALRADIDPLSLQHLGGWEDLQMVDHYAQMDDEDLMRAHEKHSPIDNLDRLKQQA